MHHRHNNGDNYHPIIHILNCVNAQCQKSVYKTYHHILMGFSINFDLGSLDLGFFVRWHRLSWSNILVQIPPPLQSEQPTFTVQMLYLVGSNKISFPSKLWQAGWGGEDILRQQDPWQHSSLSMCSQLWLTLTNSEYETSRLVYRTLDSSTFTSIRTCLMTSCNFTFAFLSQRPPPLLFPETVFS